MLSTKEVVMVEFSKQAEALGILAMESFRLNSKFLAAGDRLGRDLNITSSRWQVLGSLINADQPMTVAQIARQMGLKRQSVQRVTDWLWEQQLVEYQSNPRHRRAKLVEPTDKGISAHKRLEGRRAVWADDETIRQLRAVLEKESHS
ncbi:MAG: MarR family transcriptional regulator [Gammaproteobacteria bacterium]|nr:MarR family transcriptional regulator [Gammaproteobacteria bacterium]